MITNKQVDDFIEDWCNLYPEGVTFNGYKLRSKPKDCVNKMKTFCKKNQSYTKDIIFAATRMYLAQQEAKGYEYTKKATNFISRLGEPSLLEEFCERAKDILKYPFTPAKSFPAKPDECYFPNDFI